MDELAMVAAAREGDLNAFNRLVLAHQEMAFNLACRMLNDDDAAADATQTAFLSAYRNLNQLPRRVVPRLGDAYGDQRLLR